MLVHVSAAVSAMVPRTSVRKASVNASVSTPESYSEEEVDALDALRMVVPRVHEGDVKDALGNRHLVHPRAPPRDCTQQRC